MTRALTLVVLMSLVSGCNSIGTVVGGELGIPGDPRTPDPSNPPPPNTIGAPGDTTATLSWQAPEANADGSTPVDLAGFKVYHKVDSGQYGPPIDVGNTLTYAFTDLAAGTHTFKVTAYDAPAGNESTPTGEVSKKIL